MNVAEKLKEARKKSGKTQREVAEDTGILQSTLSNYELGTRIPRDETKRLLASYYGTSVQELFFTN